MIKLIPDTNFLIYLAKYNLLDDMDNYEILLLRQVLEELIYLSKAQKVKIEDRKFCCIVISFLEVIKNRINLIKDVEGKADDAIVEFAVRKNAMVGTMDKILIKRLKTKKIPILYIRQKRFLEEK